MLPTTRCKAGAVTSQMCPGHSDLVLLQELTPIPLVGQFREPKWALCLHLLASGSLLYIAHIPSKWGPGISQKKRDREAEENQKDQKKLQPYINMHKHLPTVSQCMGKIKGRFGRFLLSQQGLLSLTYQVLFWLPPQVTLHKPGLIAQTSSMWTSLAHFVIVVPIATAFQSLEDKV